MKRYLFVALIIWGALFLTGLRKPQSVKDLGVMVEAGIDSISGKVTLSWIGDTNTYKYLIYKKSHIDSSFGSPFKELPGNLNEFTEDIKSGESVEYLVVRDAWDYMAAGYVYAGYNLKPIYSRGRVLVLCDETLYSDLSDNLSTFIKDLSGDGWIPHLKTAPRAEEFDSGKVFQTKRIIDEFYNEYKDFKSVVLIGRIAVPYSGNLAIDGHKPDHEGAWPADIYYSVMGGKWTDTIMNIEAASPRLQNFPRDGKFDQNIIPEDAALELGRIDLCKLKAFKQTEIELLKKYFESNHLYRNAVIKTSDSAIVNDYFGLDYREGFAASGWSNFSPIVGRNKISGNQLRYMVRTNSYLLAYGCGAGSYNSVYQCAYTDELEANQFNAAFALLFGSYNGDWDSEDNVLRAVLASQPLGLAVMWSGRPFWFLHHLAGGYNIGYSARLSQNSYPNEYQAVSPYARRFTHVALMGDPTLRLHYILPVGVVKAVNHENEINISWQKSEESDVSGYFIYRSDTEYGNYQLLNDTPVNDTAFTDHTPLAGFNFYMVRTAKMQFTASGSYMNLATGTKSESVFYPMLSDNELFRIFPVPADKHIKIVSSVSGLTPFEITIFDISGNRIKSFTAGGETSSPWIADMPLTDESGAEIARGVYYINIKNMNINIFKKVIKI